MAVDGRVFDCGVQTGRKHCARSTSGRPRSSAGLSGEYDNGNGSLMRVLPLALWHQGSDAELVQLAHQQSQITHGHPRSLVCCALYCLWARRIMAGAGAEGVEAGRQCEAVRWSDAVATLRGLYGDTHLRTELENHVRPDDLPAEGTGYVVDTLRTVRAVMEQPSFERVVLEAIAHGHDTDTTACVAGGLAGARHGVGGIPARWIEALRGRELAEPLVEGLVARVTRGR